VSEPEKPLHVRVAEVLGWTKARTPIGFRGEVWCAVPPRGWPREAGPQYNGPGGETVIPLFDTDWSATGPVIEKYGIGVWKDWPTSTDPWTAHVDKGDAKEYGATALLAVCNLIVYAPQHFSLDSRA
jgi:hypothetical protein